MTSRLGRVRGWDRLVVLLSLSATASFRSIPLPDLGTLHSYTKGKDKRETCYNLFEEKEVILEICPPNRNMPWRVSRIHIRRNESYYDCLWGFYNRYMRRRFQQSAAKDTKQIECRKELYNTLFCSGSMGRRMQLRGINILSNDVLYSHTSHLNFLYKRLVYYTEGVSISRAVISYVCQR